MNLNLVQSYDHILIGTIRFVSKTNKIVHCNKSVSKERFLIFLEMPSTGVYKASLTVDYCRYFDIVVGTGIWAIPKHLSP